MPVDTRIETAGMALAGFLMQLCGSRRLHPNNLKNNGCDVVLLVGNHEQGAIALAAGRHLVLRGVNVMTLIVRENVVVGEPVMHNKDDQHLQVIMRTLKSRSLKSDIAQRHFHGLSSYVLAQLRLFLVAGGDFLVSPQDLPQPQVAPVDFIVDAMLNASMDPSTIQFLFTPNTNALCTAIRWANDNRAPTISVDVPSGLDATTGRLLTHMRPTQAIPVVQNENTTNLLAALFGAPVDAIPPSPKIRTSQPVAAAWDEDLFIVPRYTVALGLPKLGLLHIVRNPSASVQLGEVYLLDMGLISECIKHVLDSSNAGSVKTSEVVVAADNYVVPFAEKWFVNLRPIE